MNLNFSSLVNPPYNPIDQSTTRFSTAEWFHFVQSTQIAIVGVGGIGSWLALMIARLNPMAIALMDDDQFDFSNMAGQLFTRNSVGMMKVDAVADMVKAFAGYNKVQACGQRLTEETSVPAILMCGFDNMAARRAAYNAWKRRVSAAPAESKKKFLFLDGRLAAETLQVFCITGDAPYYMDQYEKDWLFSDEEAESTVCSYKQTSYCANLIASIMTNLFVNWCTNQCSPLVDRYLPFMVEYSAEQMYLKSEV